jgi:O-antigen/teichoic acid export membrane protein
MKKKLVIHNAATSILQIVVSGISLILLYKILIRFIGIERLGVWSLVLATTSMAQLAAMGITGSIVKFVAKYSATNENDKLALLIETATTSIAFIFVIILLVAYPCARQYLKYALQGNLCQAALSILPMALIAYWIAMLTSVFQAGLYGSQLIMYRNYLLMADSISYLVICYFVAGKFGLIGLAYARVIQNLLSMLVSWAILKKHIPNLPMIPCRWDRTIFREIIGYSMNFQVISILTILCDPLTKGFLSRFGSASMVGYYEMANRLVQQFRSLIVNANQVLVPAFAQLKELEPEKIQTMYLKSYSLLFYIALPVFSTLIISAPLVSELWIGRNESMFVASMIILSVGWFVNTLCVPAYYAGLGTGDLRWNVISHAIMAVLNFGLGFILGKCFGALGVINGWAIALAMGGIILSISFHKINRLSMKELLPLSSRWLAASCLGGILLSYLLFRNASHSISPIIINGAMVASFIVVMAGPIWIHPMRKELMEWILVLRRKSATV